jgi:hypothetical protein
MKAASNVPRFSEIICSVHKTKALGGKKTGIMTGDTLYDDKT